jgi:hypothetical protein
MAEVLAWWNEVLLEAARGEEEGRVVRPAPMW